MAEYITANRWITGVATHKTKCGRILCTGLGCVGCFPQDFPVIACELEVYDSKTGLLFAESCTDDSTHLSNAIETRSQKIKIAKQKHRFKRKKSHNTELKTETDTLDKNTDFEKTESGEFEKLFLTEYEQGTEEAYKKEIFTETEKFPTTRRRYHSIEESEFPSNAEKLTQRDSHRVDRRVVEREDCVCLYFALEYSHNSRRLSDLSILEIVSSLTPIMHVNKIKCVQRLNGLWHIVLRTRENLRYLLTNGVRIRGRWFRVVQDNIARK